MLGAKCNNKRKDGKVRKNFYPKTPNQLRYRDKA